MNWVKQDRISLYQKVNLFTGANDFCCYRNFYIFRFLFFLLRCLSIRRPPSIPSVCKIHIKINKVLLIFFCDSLFFVCSVSYVTYHRTNRKFFFFFFSITVCQLFYHFGKVKKPLLFIFTIHWQTCQRQVRWWYFFFLEMRTCDSDSQNTSCFFLLLLFIFLRVDWFLFIVFLRFVFVWCFYFHFSFEFDFLTDQQYCCYLFTVHIVHSLLSINARNKYIKKKAQVKTLIDKNSYGSYNIDN